MRSVFVLFLLVFCFSGFGQIINFSDPNFKNALVNTKCVDTGADGKGDVDADVNNDGEIDIAEALKVNRLHISNKSIVRLDGINYFKNLKSLNCNHNLIEEINLDSLNVIYDIHLEFNNIKVLKLMNMDLLENLYCYNNKLDTLLLAQFPNLIYFNCSHNNLGDLKLFNLKKLRLLSCSHNKLKNLDLAELVNLESLRCNNNQLSELNVGELQKLETFDCSYNYLTTLNISGLKNLRLLRCHNNNLTHLYIKNGKSPFNWKIIPNQLLKYVCCNENEIRNLKSHLSVYGFENFDINSNCP